MSITKKSKVDYLKMKLATDKVWALKAMLLIYDRQTADEKSSETTSHDNKIGYSGAHAEIMSSFSKQYRKWNKLSDKQMKVVFKIIPKYWKQVLSVTDDQKLIGNMLNDGVITETVAFDALLAI